ncbi:MAG TPA: hypothetical protein VNE18_04895 [Rhodanobacter sp.]|nr:hypothetical protein [Rhodanobacter sp.]
MRIAQQVDQVGVDVLDPGSVGVDKQDPVLGSLEQSTVAAFGYAQRFAYRIIHRIGGR